MPISERFALKSAQENKKNSFLKSPSFRYSENDVAIQAVEIDLTLYIYIITPIYLYICCFVSKYPMAHHRSWSREYPGLHRVLGQTDTQAIG